MKRKVRNINKQDRRIYAVIMQEVKQALKARNINFNDYNDTGFDNTTTNKYSKKDKTFLFIGYNDFTGYILYISISKLKYCYIELYKVNDM